MRRNKKRLLSVLLSTVIALALFAAAPMTVYALASPPGPSAIIGINLIGLGDQNGIGTAGGTWNWDQANLTLTLDNLNFTTTADFALAVQGDAKIVLIGSNFLTSTNTLPGNFSDGIYAAGNLTITGPGSLNVSSGPAAISYGILATGNLTIDNGAVVTATGNIAAFSIGIYAFDGLTISGGSTVTSTGGAATSFSAGIFAISNFLINGDSVIIATGGSMPDGDPLLNTGSYGIYKWGGSGIPAFNLSSSMLQAAGETMAIVIFDNSTNTPTLSYFTVPAGYTYWINDLVSDPGGSGTVSDGSFLISSLYRFAKIMFVPPPSPQPPPPGPSPNVPQTSDVNNAVGWTVLLALVVLGVIGLAAWRRRQGARE